MIRKTIEQLPDTVAFKISQEEIKKVFRNNTFSDQERLRLKAFADLAVLSRRFVNLGIAFEEMLSEQMMHEVSAAIYGLEWYEIWKQATRPRSYWERLWAALRGRS